jgi:hypothetical protein
MKWKTTDELDAELSAGFYGTSQYYFNRLYPSMKYTDGIQFLAANGFAWLSDEIGLFIHPRLKIGGGFYIIVLDTKGSKAKLSVCEDISEDKSLVNIGFTKEIPLTDAPQGRLKLYWQDGVLFCPSEY